MWGVPRSAQPPASDRSKEAQSSSTLEEVAKLELQENLSQNSGKGEPHPGDVHTTWYVYACVNKHKCTTHKL